MYVTYEVSYCIGLTTEIFRFFSVACCERFIIFCIFLIVQDLLARVEQAVDRFLYWDEEVMLYEAVTSVSSSHSCVLEYVFCGLHCLSVSV